MGLGNLIEGVFTGQLRATRARNKMLTELYEGGRITRARNSAGGAFRSPEDSTETRERLQMIREARQLEDDFPLASMILDAFQTYALGSIRYQPMTGDTAFNAEIMEWLKYWFENCDASGRFSFQEIARLALRGKKRDGESGIIHMDTDDEYRLQLVSGDRIGDPTIVRVFTGNNRNGIITDDNGRVLSYDIYKRNADVYTYTFDLNVPAGYFSHVFDPFRIDQYHGVTAFKSVITRMRDLKEVMDYTRLNIKYRATQLPYYKTETGEAPLNTSYDDTVPQITQQDRDGVQLETVGGAEQQFIRTTEGIFEYPNDFPNQQFAPMIEAQVREIMAGVNLAYEFLWGLDKLTGTVGRLVVERQERVMKMERENLERQFIKTSIRRAIQSGINQGAIRRDGPTKFDGECFYGARISADYGRDHKTDIELVRAGLLTETEYQHIHGHDPEQVRAVRLEETLGLVADAKTVATASGMDPENAMNVIRNTYTTPPKTQNKTQSESITKTVESDRDVSPDLERSEMSASYKPTAAMAAHAERALERRAELPESKRGMTATGIARARDISNRRNLSEATVREMNAWFARHQSTSRESPNYDKREKAWVAWQGWGGDAAKSWAEAIVKRLDKEEA